MSQMFFHYQFLVLPLALILDQFVGDPPNCFHPTAWMGSLIHRLMRFRPRGNWLHEFIFGIIIIFIGLVVTISVGWSITFLASRLQLWVGIFLQAFALKMTLSLRSLNRAAWEVQSALEAKNLSEARRLLSWHLVSRDTSQLTESQVSAGAIESVAENASDGIIAPLFFYTVGGLPAALAYRFVNTADSILGYRDVEREWLGKSPARFDDLLNFVPARLTGLFIVLSAPFCRASLLKAWSIMWRDSTMITSPNAGVPMSAMAGALGVELEKIDHYCLGAGLRLPEVADLIRARAILVSSILLSVFVLALFSFFLVNNL